MISEHFVRKSVVFFVQKDAFCLIFRVDCDGDVVCIMFGTEM